MLPSSDPEMLMLLVQQRREEVRRAAEASRSLTVLLGGAVRRSALALRAPGRALRMRAPRRPA